MIGGISATFLLLVVVVGGGVTPAYSTIPTKEKLVFVHRSLNWYDARAECQRRGGDLATHVTKHDLEDLNFPNFKLAWLGGIRRNSWSTDVEWLNGDLISPDDGIWLRDEPSAEIFDRCIPWMLEHFGRKKETCVPACLNVDGNPWDYNVRKPKPRKDGTMGPAGYLNTCIQIKFPICKIVQTRRFVYVADRKNLDDARAECKRRGGDLPTQLTRPNLQYIMADIFPSGPAHDDDWNWDRAWVGGSLDQWVKWLDGEDGEDSGSGRKTCVQLSPSSRFWWGGQLEERYDDSGERGYDHFCRNTELPYLCEL